MLTLKNIEYKASIIGILIMLALKNINYKASIIGILMMLALKNINYKASNIGILIMLALNEKTTFFAYRICRNVPIYIYSVLINH